MVDVSLVVPVYNEEQVLPLFMDSMEPVLEASGKTYEILFVDDGSVDGSLSVLKQYAATNATIKIISFSRNFGKEAALTAGLQQASGAAVVPIDADLQDPPSLLLEFIKKWEEGFDVVVGIRVNRKSDSFVKRTSAKLFYRLFNSISSHSINPRAGDFRLMTRRVVDAILRLPERDRFMKGLFSWVGFQTAVIEYCRPNRIQGQTKWNYWKLFNFAISGICSFSTLPLRVWSYFGVVVSFLAFLFLVWVVAKKIVFGDPVTGYASLMAVLLFLGGVQLLGLGVMGEYIGRLLKETKQRPLYIVSELVNCHKKI